jgi:hypothetical protein
VLICLMVSLTLLWARFGYCLALSSGNGCRSRMKILNLGKSADIEEIFKESSKIEREQLPQAKPEPKDIF